MIPALSPEELIERYTLLAAATDQLPNQAALAEVPLSALERLVTQDLRELARSGSPDHFADTYVEFTQELERLRELCAFPALGRKVIVALGGAFSAGKSSLINAILDKKLLSVQVDPTTSLPTYLLNGSAFSIQALNLYGKNIPLTHPQLATLTHDEMDLYGSCVSRLLRAAFVTDPEIPWKHLALIDTPGYSKPDDEHHSARTDAQVARTQLNQANHIIWVVSAEAGTIPEEDLQFLASLRQDIPRLVVVSRADKREPADVDRIVGLIRRTLEQRNLPCVDVLPISARRPDQYPVQPLLDHLRAWDQEQDGSQFPYNFKLKFFNYLEFLQQECRDANLRLNRLGRLGSLSGEKDAAAFEALHANAKAQVATLTEVEKRLRALQRQFFTELAEIGRLIGMELAEPSDASMVTLKPASLLALLQEMRPRNSTCRDHGKSWHAFMAQQPCANYDKLLRRRSAQHAHWLSALADKAATVPADRLLRPRGPGNDTLAHSSGDTA